MNYVLGLIIFAVPTLVAGAPLILLPQYYKLIWLIFAPIAFFVMFIITTGLLSRLGQKCIIPGSFPRLLSHPVYRGRRIFGFCWTALFYFKVIYWFALSIPFLKKVCFRLFGYSKSLDFTIYPDTWIRDLPLLDFGEGAYIANRSTLGTNVALANGEIFVDRISLGAKSVVGHLTLMGPGSMIAAHTEVANNCVIGIRVKIGKNCKIMGFAGVNHGAVIGDGVTIGPMAYVGLKCRIRDGIIIHPAANIRTGSIISTQEEADLLLSSETANLLDLKRHLAEISLEN